MRALGRLAEALEPVRAGLAMRVKQKNWKNAALGTINLSELEQALVLARPGGFIRSFTDMGPSIIPLLIKLRQSGVHPRYLAQIIESFPDSELSTRPQIDAELVDKLLTPRQTEILVFLKKGYSYQEIADVLGVSLNTIRKHVSNIYAKLKVSSRQQAIHKADEIGMLP